MLVLHCAYVCNSQSEDNTADKLARANSAPDTSNRVTVPQLSAHARASMTLSAAVDCPCWALQSITDMYAGICLACYCELHQASLPLQACGYTNKRPYGHA